MSSDLMAPARVKPDFEKGAATHLCEPTELGPRFLGPSRLGMQRAPALERFLGRAAHQGKVRLPRLGPSDAGLRRRSRFLVEGEENDAGCGTVQAVDRVDVRPDLVAHELEEGGGITRLGAAVDEEPPGLVDRNEAVVAIQDRDQLPGGDQRPDLSAMVALNGIPELFGPFVGEPELGAPRPQSSGRKVKRMLVGEADRPVDLVGDSGA